MTAPGVVAAPVLVGRALARLAEHRLSVLALPYETSAHNAVRAGKLAALAALEQRWWAVLTHHASAVPFVYRRAAISAEAKARNDARFWAESAGYWAGRADGLSHDGAESRVRWSA